MNPRRLSLVRWITLVVIVVGSVTALAVIGMTDHDMRQIRVVRTMVTVVITAAALVLWVAILSGWRWRVRGAVLGGVALIGLLAALSVRVEGVSGDVVPIFAWRWSAPPDASVPTEAAPPDAPPATLSGLADFPQFLGLHRNGRVEGMTLARDWASTPPEIVWRRRIGAGWSGFAVVGERAITQEQRGGKELVVCYDAATGRELWTHAEDARYETTLGGIGPRATPTVDGDRVLTLGALGHLNCLDLESGRRVWSADLRADAATEPPEWGYAGSPLVTGGRVIVSAGGRDGKSMIAYDRVTGKRIWTGGNAPSGYSSPALATLLDAPQVLILNLTGVAAHDPETGAVLWSVPLPGVHPKVAQPVPVGDAAVFVSAGYGMGCVFFELKRDGSGTITPNRVYAGKQMKAKFANMVLDGTSLYGLDDGILACLDVRTGKRLWKGGRYGHGQMILAGRLLVIQAEDGSVVLVEATPNEHRQVVRQNVFDAKTWNSPALAGCYLFLRNDREAACLRLPLQD